MRLSLSLVMLLGTVWGASPAKSHYPDPSSPFVAGLFSVAALQDVALNGPKSETVAVLDLEGQGISASEAASLTNRLSTELVKTGAITVVERGQMEQILAEQDFQLIGCTSDECAVVIGQLLGVSTIIAGSVGKVGETYTLDVHAIDVETGKIMLSIDRDYRGKIDGLLQEISSLAQDIVRDLASGQVVTLGGTGPQDVVGGIDVNSPNFKYPGKAMLYSLIVPGAGQLYVRQPLKTVVFLGAEIIAILLLKDYNQRGLDQTQAFKDSADVHWDFRHWIDRASSFTGPGWEDLPNIGTQGTHSLDYFVVMTEGERPMLFGKTGDERFLQLYHDPDTTDHVFVKMNDEYYENIGKYNQFLSGWDDAWDDADPASPDIDETPSGLVARTPHREAHLSMREEANRLKSTASYVASAIMFNHVLSAVDAIFATAKWNRRHALRVGGRLWFDPTYTLGVRGVQFSLAW